MPAQVQTNQNKGTAPKPARTSRRSNGKLGMDRQKVKYGWSIGSNKGAAKMIRSTLTT